MMLHTQQFRKLTKAVVLFCIGIMTFNSAAGMTATAEAMADAAYAPSIPSSIIPLPACRVPMPSILAFPLPVPLLFEPGAAEPAVATIRVVKAINRDQLE